MKISIITASYNYAEFIAESIDSVLAQSYNDWELIIVDDASVDNSIEIIEKYVDSRIKLVKHEKNMGLKSAILTGLKYASGDWVAFLESDDIWTIDYLAQKIEVIEENPQVKLIFNDCEFFGDEKRVKSYNWALGFSRRKLLKKKFPQNIFYDMYLDNLIFTFSCAMVERKALLETSFNTPIDALLDWWLWIHLAYKNEFYYIPQQLTKWRLHKQSYILNRKKDFPTRLQDLAFWDAASTERVKIFFYIIYSKILWVLRKIYFKIVIALN